MSQPCTTPKCERISRGSCDCCKQNLCLQHLNEHNTLLLTQLNPLTDEINLLGDRLQSLDIHKTTNHGRQKLENWRRECHEKIDSFFEKKCQELNRVFDEKLDQQKQEILCIQSKIAKLIREQEVTRQDIDLLTSTIRQLENQMKKIEETNIQVTTYSLQIDDSSVQVQEMNENELDLSNLPPACRTLSWTTESSVAITADDQFLLIHRERNLCLIDKEMNIVKQVLWEHGSIWDMCWASSISRFIILQNDNIFLFDEKTMIIENIETIEKRKWFSCTCSNTSLFLSTDVWGPSVLELKLSPSVSIVKEWKSPVTCSKDERIDGMVYKNNMCAMVIMNNVQKLLRLELRSCETLDRIWSLPLDIKINQKIVFRCCSLPCDEWMVMDYETKRLLHVTKDGKLKTTIPYNKPPHHAQLFASDILAISTIQGINFHKI